MQRHKTTLVAIEVPESLRRVAKLIDLNPQRPFDPRRVRFYYGWVILVASVIGTLASIPGQTAGVSVFTDHLTATTGLSRVNLSLAYLIGTAASAFLLPRAGIWIDHFGARVVSLWAALGLAATLTGLSTVNAMSTVTAMAVMTLGFALMRFTGQGLLTMSSRTMLSQWFDRHRGLVSAASNTIMVFFFALAPALLYALIDLDGFRTAWRILAAILLFGVCSVVALFFRDTPESCGIRIDGHRRTNDPEAAQAIDSEPPDAPLWGHGRGEALRDLRFWAISIPVVTSAMVSTALTFHIVDFGREVGIGEAEILQIFVPVALVSVPVTLAGGWLIDRVRPMTVALVMASAQVVWFVTTPLIDSVMFRIIALTCWGIAQGCYAPLTSAAIPRVFGRLHLGAINGAQMSLMVLASAVGPALFSIVKSTGDSYSAALYGSIIFPLAGILAATKSLSSRPLR